MSGSSHITLIPNKLKQQRNGYLKRISRIWFKVDHCHCQQRLHYKVLGWTLVIDEIVVFCKINYFKNINCDFLNFVLHSILNENYTFYTYFLSETTWKSVAAKYFLAPLYKTADVQHFGGVWSSKAIMEKNWASVFHSGFWDDHNSSVRGNGVYPRSTNLTLC